jgi:hypothetical protein
MLRFGGELIQPAQQQALKDFADQLAGHPHGGVIDGRLVQAAPQPAGITSTMHNALRVYMKPEEFLRWQAAQHGRTVATGGKTFLADDEIVTAVIHPLPGLSQEFVDLAAHELIEMATLLRQQRDHWVTPDDPDEADGIVLFDEYCSERVRQEIRDVLGWREGRLDASPGLVSMTADIAARMPETRLDPPPAEFWAAWLAMAQVWAMVCGRGAAASASARRELMAWARHGLIANDGWSPVAAAMDALYQQPGLDREELARQAGRDVRLPIIAYGREAWAHRNL